MVTILLKPCVYLSYRSPRNKETNGGKKYKVQGFTLNPESICQKKRRSFAFWFMVVWRDTVIEMADGYKNSIMA